MCAEEGGGWLFLNLLNLKFKLTIALVRFDMLSPSGLLEISIISKYEHLNDLTNHYITIPSSITVLVVTFPRLSVNQTGIMFGNCFAKTSLDS